MFTELLEKYGEIMRLNVVEDRDKSVTCLWPWMVQRFEVTR